MITYKVIRDFSDYTDGMFVYRAGDRFPRSGLDVSEDRIKQLLGNENKQGVPVIKEDASFVTGATEEQEAGVDPSQELKAKRKPRKGQRKNA